MNRTMNKTMKTVAIDRFGGLNEMKIRELPVPELDADEILVRVEAAGVGVWDPFEREGGFAKEFNMSPKFPIILGSDGAGTVEAVGEKVSHFKKGDRVYGISFMSPKGGFYAEHVVMKETNAARIPGKLSATQAGAMAVDVLTAYAGLETTLHLKSDESVLIFGASGGIGHIAVQLAKRMGARVLAVASGQDGVALAKRLRADKVIDGHSDDIVAAAREFAPKGIDAVLLTAGGAGAEKCLTTLRSGGRVAFPTGVELAQKDRPGITVQVYNGEYQSPPFEQINRLIESGPFDIEVAKTFSLEQAADAQRALDDHYLGKLAITLN
jgi:NADPH2:quinone reductase